MTDRKARLAALAARAGRSNQESTAPDEASNEKDESEAAAPKVNFRNYIPQDASLQPQQATEEQEVDQQPVTKKPKLEEALQKAQQEAQQSTAAATIGVAATKKINWDLKRDLELQMDRLERKTQKALVELLKERLSKEAEEEVLD
jgi:coiled-coil domain-containing protein 12